MCPTQPKTPNCQTPMVWCHADDLPRSLSRAVSVRSGPPGGGDVWRAQNRKGREHKCLSVGPLLEDARSATSQLEGRVYLTRSPQESKNLYRVSTRLSAAASHATRLQGHESGPGTLRSATAQQGNYRECGRLIRATGARHLGGCYVAVAGGKASTRLGAEGRVRGMWKSGPTDANRAKELT